MFSFLISLIYSQIFAIYRFHKNNYLKLKDSKANVHDIQNKKLYHLFNNPTDHSINIKFKRQIDSKNNNSSKKLRSENDNNFFKVIYYSQIK